MSGLREPPFLLLKKVDMASYPTLGKREATLVGKRPGGVIIESDTHWFLRRFVPVSMCFAPVLSWRRRRRFATEAGKATVKSMESFRQCVVFGTSAAMATSLAYSLGTDVLRLRFKNSDEVVDEALSIAMDPTASRWARTTGALQFVCSTLSVAAGVTSVPARVAYGWGIGTVLALPISWSEFDKSLGYMF